MKKYLLAATLLVGSVATPVKAGFCSEVSKAQMVAGASTTSALIGSGILVFGGAAAKTTGLFFAFGGPAVAMAFGVATSATVTLPVLAAALPAATVLGLAKLVKAVADSGSN